MRIRSVALLFAALWLGGCGLYHLGSEPIVPLRTSARESLLAADAERGTVLARRGWPEGVLGWLSPEVVYLREGSPAVYGRDAVATLLSGEKLDASGTHLWQPLGGATSEDGRSGYTYGVHAVTTGANKTELLVDRYIAFWRRASGGIWRVEAYAEVGDPGVDSREAAVSSSPPQRGPRPRQVAAAIATIMRTDSVFAIRADRNGIAAAFAQFAAPEAVLLAGTELVIGPSAIREFYAANSVGSSLIWEPVYGDVAGSADLGFTVGEYIFTGRGPTGAAIQRFGKYLTVWKRQPNGGWKFVADGGNGNPSPRAH